MPREKKIKRGVISELEGIRIRKMVEKKMDAEQIADQLRRPISQIENHLAKFYGVSTGDVEAKLSPVEARFVRELRQKPYWKEFLRNQYEPKEIEYYEERYASFMASFGDVTPAEEIQIYTLCDTLLLIQKYKNKRYISELEVTQFTSQINDLKTKLLDMDEDNPDENLIRSLGILESKRKHATDSLSMTVKEFEILTKRQDEIFKNLKATREQRMKNLEDSSKSYTALIKVLQDRKLREVEGRQAELRRIATKKARKQLSEPHKYINGEVHPPLMNADVIEGKGEFEDASEN